jgi:hypothetical protein
MNILPFESQVRVMSALTEGVSIRSTERLTGVNRNTIMSLGLRVGEGCERLHDRTMRDLQVNLIELDEQWDFVAKKQRHVKDGDPDSYGDAWVFIALASTQKAVLSYRVGCSPSAQVGHFGSWKSFGWSNNPRCRSAVR